MVVDVLRRTPKEVTEKRETTGAVLNNVTTLAPHPFERPQGPLVSSATLGALLRTDGERNVYVNAAAALMKIEPDQNTNVFMHRTSNKNLNVWTLAIGQDRGVLSMDYDLRDNSLKDVTLPNQSSNVTVLNKDQNLLLSLAQVVEKDLIKAREDWAEKLTKERTKYLRKEGHWTGRMLDVIAHSMEDVYPYGFVLMGAAGTEQNEGTEPSKVIRLFTDARLYEDAAAQLASQIDLRSGDDPSAITFKYEVGFEKTKNPENPVIKGPSRLSFALRGGLGFSIESVFPLMVGESPNPWLGGIDPVERSFQAFLAGEDTALSSRGHELQFLYRHGDVPGVGSLFERTMHDETLNS